MTELLGAWSLRDEPDSGESIVSCEDRERMLRVLGSASDATELSRGRLWLHSDANKNLVLDDAVLAYEGFLPMADAVLEASALAKHSDSLRVDGHCVALHARSNRCSLFRSLSGGERLYFTRIDDIVLFSSSVRPLLAHRRVRRGLNHGVINEVVLSGHVIFGAETLFDGVFEVLPGHELPLTECIGEQRFLFEASARSARGPAKQLAREFRDALCQAVEASIGATRPVPIALSGGIDSSAIAAALVEVVGARNVHALSYEFDDPGHSVETHYARSVSRRLGIARHDAFQLSFDEFIRTIPEHVWRSESAVHWPKAFLLQVARHIGSLGYDRYLTGFGIGSHMAYLQELSWVLEHLPGANSWLRYWKLSRFGPFRFFHHLAKLHPGLEPPHNRLYDSVLHWLADAGVIRDREAFYPKDFSVLLRARGRPKELDPALAALPLAQRLQHSALHHLISCVDVTRSERASRGVGVYRISPAHFAGTLPYAYFPPSPPPFLYGPARRLRPGKYLLRLAYRGVLPDEVLFRKKSWADAVASDSWRRKARVMMLRAMPTFPANTAELGVDYPNALIASEPYGIQAAALSTWFYKKLFIDLPPQAAAPTWHGLLPQLPTAALSDSLRSVAED